MTPISPSRVKDTNSLINCAPLNENIRRVVQDKITYRSVGYDPYVGAVKTGDVKDRAIARLPGRRRTRRLKEDFTLRLEKKLST